MNTQARPQRPATYQDVLDAPAHMVAEIAGGRLHIHPRPALRHSLATFRMAGRIDEAFRGGPDEPAGWHFAIEPALHLGPDVLVPDLAGWRRERMPVFPDAAFADLAPDWVCEILSPSTRRFDLTEKRALYGAHAVAHLWLVDPDARTFEAFALDAGRWTLAAAFQDGDDVHAAPFEALTFPLGALWPDLRGSRYWIAYLVAVGAPRCASLSMVITRYSQETNLSPLWYIFTRHFESDARARK